MKQDLRSVICQTAQFLDKNLVLDQVLVLEDHLGFKSMKNNRAVNFKPVIEFYKKHNLIDTNCTFIRSGLVREGKQKMSPEFIKIFDEWEEKCLGKSGLKFLCKNLSLVIKCKIKYYRIKLNHFSKLTKSLIHIYL